MKEFKRKLCLLLTLAMILSTWMVPAYADTKIGSITIKNAEVGRIYTLYKIFDVKQSAEGDTVSYFTTVKDWADVIDSDKRPLDPSKPGEINPFKIKSKSLDEYDIEHKDMTPSGIEAGRGWLKNNLATLSNVIPASDIKQTTGGTSGEITFTNLPYGYYLMTTESPSHVRGTNVTVLNVYKGAEFAASGTADITYYDKNLNIPSYLEKSIDSVGDRDVAIGEEIDYSFKFLAKNYYTDMEHGGAQQIKKYTMKDTAYGLKLSTTSDVTVMWYEEDDTECNGTGHVIPLASISDLKNKFDNGKNELSITIDWIDDSGKQIFQSPIWIKVTYKMIVDETMLSATGDENFGKNTVTVDYYYGEGSHSSVTGSTPSQSLYTTGLSIGKRKAGFETKLSNAKFILYKNDGGNKYYQWATASDGTHYPAWVANESDATVVVADNDYNTIEFKGLTAGNYYLEEVAAPDGYSLPENPFDITIAFDEDSATFKYSGTSSFEHTDPALIKIQNEDKVSKNYLTVLVRNDTNTTVLPTTGGAGTILLIVGGSILFLAAGLILVTKKRMYNEEA